MRAVASVERRRGALGHRDEDFRVPGMDGARCTVQVRQLREDCERRGNRADRERDASPLTAIGERAGQMQHQASDRALKTGAEFQQPLTQGAYLGAGKWVPAARPRSSCIST